MTWQGERCGAETNDGERCRCLPVSAFEEYTNDVADKYDKPGRCRHHQNA